jgi:hypothetical protein
MLCFPIRHATSQKQITARLSKRLSSPSRNRVWGVIHGPQDSVYRSSVSLS